MGEPLDPWDLSEAGRSGRCFEDSNCRNAQQLPQKFKKSKNWYDFRHYFHHIRCTPGLTCRTPSEWKKSDGTQVNRRFADSVRAIAIQIGLFGLAMQL